MPVASSGLPSLLQVTPVYGRTELTRLLLRQRRIVYGRAAQAGVRCETVVVGCDENLDTAEEFGFPTIEAPNELGRRFNDGYQYAVEHGFDLVMGAGSDHVFDPALLVLLARDAEPGTIQLTMRYTVVHASGSRAISYRSPVWILPVYPVGLIRRAGGRPADESIMRGCDTSTYRGVKKASRGAVEMPVEIGPLDIVQFCSTPQVTPWTFHQSVARVARACEGPVPWDEIEALHGAVFVNDIRRFYGLSPKE